MLSALSGASGLIINSTISGLIINSTISGLIINSTISGNVAVGPGGGIAPVAIGNSIIAGNPKRPGDLSDELRAHSHLLR